MLQTKNKLPAKKILIFVFFVLALFVLFGQKGKSSTSKEPNLESNSKKIYDFSHRRVGEQSGATSWIFEGKNKPPFTYSDKKQLLKDINLVLSTISLPLVSDYVVERESLTGLRVHRGQFLWENYQSGKLIIHRDICKDLDSKEYDCIWKVTVSN